MRILIQNGLVVDPVTKTSRVQDIYIDNGVIDDIGENLDYSGADIDVFDATGLVVAPGLVDMHCHLRDPGQQYKETIETGTKAAVMGGFTTVACMPNTTPVIDDPVVVDYILSRPAYANVYPIGAITKGLQGKELANIGKLKFAGVVAVSDDGKPVANAMLMKRAMQYSRAFDCTVISHCEVPELAEEGCMNEGYIATKLGLHGIDNASESLMVAREILLAEETGCQVHIAHVSTKESIRMLRDAKARGIKITCETCPHYFTLTEEACDGYNTNAKMNPPLRTEEDRLAVIEGLRDGTIDVIATDHAPHHFDEKNCEFDKALNGIVGLETALGLGYTYLVKAGILTLEDWIAKMTVQPSDILGLGKGRLACADLVIFDPQKEYTVSVKDFQSKSKNSPYDGYKLSGKVVATIVGGEFKVREGILL